MKFNSCLLLGLSLSGLFSCGEKKETNSKKMSLQTDFPSAPIAEGTSHLRYKSPA
jgi:hypothetical protein